MEQHVAVVDDEPGVRMFIRALAESAGHEAGEYRSGEEFLCRYAPRPGCIVLGIDMNRLGGLDVLRRMKSYLWRIPTVVMSGAFPEDRVHEVLRLGAMAYVRKPFTGMGMAGLIRLAVDGTLGGGERAGLRSLTDAKNARRILIATRKGHHKLGEPERRTANAS